ARARSVSCATPAMESTIASRNWRSFSFCARVKGSRRRSLSFWWLPMMTSVWFAALALARPLAPRTAGAVVLLPAFPLADFGVAARAGFAVGFFAAGAFFAAGFLAAAFFGAVFFACFLGVGFLVE